MMTTAQTPASTRKVTARVWSHVGATLLASVGVIDRASSSSGHALVVSCPASRRRTSRLSRRERTDRLKPSRSEASVAREGGETAHRLVSGLEDQCPDALRPDCQLLDVHRADPFPQ